MRTVSLQIINTRWPLLLWSAQFSWASWGGGGCHCKVRKRVIVSHSIDHLHMIVKRQRRGKFDDDYKDDVVWSPRPLSVSLCHVNCCSIIIGKRSWCIAELILRVLRTYNTQYNPFNRLNLHATLDQLNTPGGGNVEGAAERPPPRRHFVEESWEIFSLPLKIIVVGNCTITQSMCICTLKIVNSIEHFIGRLHSAVGHRQVNVVLGIVELLIQKSNGSIGSRSGQVAINLLLEAMAAVTFWETCIRLMIDKCACCCSCPYTNSVLQIRDL